MTPHRCVVANLAAPSSCACTPHDKKPSGQEPIFVRADLCGRHISSLYRVSVMLVSTSICTWRGQRRCRNPLRKKSFPSQNCPSLGTMEKRTSHAATSHVNLCHMTLSGKSRKHREMARLQVSET